MWVYETKVLHLLTDERMIITKEPNGVFIVCDGTVFTGELGENLPKKGQRIRVTVEVVDG